MINNAENTFMQPAEFMNVFSVLDILFTRDSASFNNIIHTLYIFDLPLQNEHIKYLACIQTIK